MGRRNLALASEFILNDVHAHCFYDFDEITPDIVSGGLRIY